MTCIKICGLRRPEDIAAVNDARPDMAGFIVNVKRSARSVDARTACALAAQLQRGIEPVAVFVDEAPEVVADIVSAGPFRTVQLHGHEDEAYIARLRSLSDARIIQAFGIKSEADARAAQASSADLVLLDSPGGGTGVAFPWGFTAHITRPFLLAGGLAPDTVADAIRRIRPWGVDMSSGVETNAAKDPAKIRAATAAVRFLA